MNIGSVAGVIVKNGCGAEKRCWDVTQLNLRGSVSPHPGPGGQGKSYAGILRRLYIISYSAGSLKKPGRGATVPAALKFIPQYVAAAISLC